MGMAGLATSATRAPLACCHMSTDGTAWADGKTNMKQKSALPQYLYILFAIDFDFIG
jgi:hypothetical protein